MTSHIPNNIILLWLSTALFYPIPNNQTANATTFPTFTKSSPIEEYIESTLGLDFDINPRPNVFSPWLKQIEKRDDLTYDPRFRSFLISKAYELEYQHQSPKNRKRLAKAILDIESYIAGFHHPLITPTTFDKLWFLKFEKEIIHHKLHIFSPIVEIKAGFHILT